MGRVVNLLCQGTQTPKAASGPPRVLARLDAAPHDAAPSEATGPEVPFATAGRLFLHQSARRIRQALARLNDHDHSLIEETARRLLDPGR